MGRLNTKQQILEASECLFACNGYGVSTRSIAGMAGVNLAAINYYFGKKQNLVEAVCERRLASLNEECSQKLRSLSRAGMKENRTFPVSRLLKAFLKPFFSSKDADPVGLEHPALIGRAMIAPNGAVQRIFLRTMRPSLELLFQLLCETLPRIPQEVISCRLLLSMGTLGYTLSMIGTRSFLFKEAKFSHPDSLIDGLAPFLGSAIQAPYN